MSEVLCLNRKYSDYSNLTAQAAMEDTLVAACHANIRNLRYAEDRPLPDDLTEISASFVAEVLEFVSSCTQERLFCCSVVLCSSKAFHVSSVSLQRVSKDSMSYTLGEKLFFRDTAYSLDDDARRRLLDSVVHAIADELASRDFIVAVTPGTDSCRIFISWGLDKEAIGYVFQITDYSQIDAIKCGVPASDVFA